MKTSPTAYSSESLFRRRSRTFSCALLLIGLIHARPVSAGLIGFYSFDDSSAPLADSSGLGNDLQSVSADPAYASSGGIQGGAYVFNGSQRLVAPIDINPDTVPTLTMGAWVKTSTLASGLRKIIGQDNGGWDRTLGLDDRNGPFRYTSFIGNGDPVVGAPGPASVEQWTFLAATYDQPNNSLTLYVDLDASTVGPLVTVTTPTGFGSGFGTVAIGGIRPDNNSEGWQGSIDNVFFFDEILSPEQLTAIRDRGRSAILGAAGDDPDLSLGALSDLQNLGKIPSVHPITVSVANGGLTKTLHVSRVTFSGPDASYYSVTTLPGGIAPGASGDLVMSFDSRGQLGNFSAVAHIESDDSGDASIALDVSARVLKGQTLLGFYSFDDQAAPLKDDSGGGKTLQNGFEGGASDPTYSSAGGVQGGAFEFGGSQRLVAPVNINPDVNPTLTMGAWVKTASLDNGLRKVLGHDNGAWDRTIGLDVRTTPAGGGLPDGTLRYAAFTGLNNNGPTQGDPPPTPTSVDAWTFLAATYDQTVGEVTLYVDLDVSSTEDAPQAIVAAANMGLGTTATAIGGLSAGGNGESWMGSIDNVFFLSGQIDAATIKAIRDNGKSALLQFLADPVLAVNVASPFGSLPQGTATKSVQLSLKNNGATRSLQIASARVVGPDAANYSLGVAPATVAAGQQGSLTVTFNSNGREGQFRASLEIISNDSLDRKTVIDLSARLPYATVSSALLGFYPFDNENNPLTDASGHGNDLTMPAGAEPTYQPQLGYEGNAYEFNGSQRLVAPININPDVVPQLTMGAWVKTSSLNPGLRKVIGQDDGGWDRTIGLDNRDGDFRYTSFIGNGSPVAGTPGPIDTETWTFLAATYDQDLGEVVVYIDLDAATQDDDLVVTPHPTGFGGGFPSVSIGSLRPDNNAEGWAGMIDNAFFYQTVLTVAELTAIRNGGAAAILPNSGIRIVAISKTATLSLTWTSTPGKSYAIEHTRSIGGTWSVIGTAASAGNEATFIDTDAARLARSSGFYRIVLQ